MPALHIDSLENDISFLNLQLLFPLLIKLVHSHSYTLIPLFRVKLKMRNKFTAPFLLGFLLSLLALLVILLVFLYSQA